MIKTTLATAFALTYLSLTSLAFAAGVEMSAGDRAKLAKERAKSSAAFSRNAKNGDANGQDGEGNPCSLDIGNINTGNRGGPREVNVFITGDVIQANRNCR
jgi:hypothetical protein